MKFIILFEDNPNTDPSTRSRLMPLHLSFLEKHKTAISAAGPLSDTDGQARGGLWIVEADNKKEVTQLVHEDPFWPTGLRKSFSILSWTQVFADGKRLIHPSATDP